MTEAPKAALSGRKMYADGESLARILKTTGLTRSTLYLWLNGGPVGPDGSRPLPPLPRRSGKRRAGEPRSSSREALVQRLWNAAERQVQEIEQRLGSEPQAAERDARALAVLVKTLRELSAFDAAQGRAPDEDDDAGPRDIDEFRNELARKIDAFVASRTNG